ncbi:MAG: hypothetical protein ACE14V_10325 [bacterium]
MDIVHHLYNILIFLVILVGPIPLCISILLLSEKYYPIPSWSHYFVIIITIWSTIQVGIGLLAGMMSYLCCSGIVIIESLMLILGIGYLIYFRHHHIWFLSLTKIEIKSHHSFTELALIAIFIILGASHLWYLITVPILDYDSTMYHLPVMARWYQSGTLSLLDQFSVYRISIPIGQLQISRYPYNWELLCTLFVFPFQEDYLVAMPNLLAWILLGLAIYLISIKLGATKLYGLIASSLVLNFPIVTSNINTMHIDLAFAAFFMVAFYFALLYRQTRVSLFLFFLLLALSMLLGIKMTGLIYGIVLVMLVFGIKKKYWIHSESLRTRKITLTHPGVVGLLSFLSLVLVGGFWYIRNYILLGNPLGHVSFLFNNQPDISSVINLGFILKTTLIKVVSLSNIEHWSILAKQIFLRLNLPFLIMVVRGLVWLILLLIKKQNFFRIPFGISVLLAVTGLIYLFTPYSGTGINLAPFGSWFGGNLRFALPFLSVLGVISALIATFIHLPIVPSLIMVVLSSMIGVSPMGIKPTLVFSILIGFVFLDLWIYQRIGFGKHNDYFKIPLRLKRMRYAIVSSIIITLLFVSYFTRVQRAENRITYFGYDIDRYFYEHIGQNEVIGYLLSYRSYLLYGKSLNRKVIYIPADSDDFQHWFDIVKENRIHIIAIGPMRKEWLNRKEYQWLNDPDGPFTRIFGVDPMKQMVFYRIKPDCQKQNIELNK